MGVTVTSFVNHDSLYGAVMQHRWPVGVCPPFVTEIKEWQGLWLCEATVFQLVIKYRGV